MRASRRVFGKTASCSARQIVGLCARQFVVARIECLGTSCRHGGSASTVRLLVAHTGAAVVGAAMWIICDRLGSTMRDRIRISNGFQVEVGGDDRVVVWRCSGS